MKRIALFGGPGSGKTTCASAFSSHMNSKGHAFYHVTEYARTFIDTHGVSSIQDCGPLLQLKFIVKQKQRESEVPVNTFGFITDSPVFLSWIYAAYYGDDSMGSYIARKDCYKEFLRSIYQYDHIFRVVREYDYVDDGCRFQAEDAAKMLDDVMAMTLRLHGVPFTDLTGTIEARTKIIADTIGV